MLGPTSVRRGFTLIELLVCLGVVTILAGILLSATNRSRERAKSVNCQAALRQVYLATVIYADDHEGRAPTKSVEATAASLCSGEGAVGMRAPDSLWTLRSGGCASP
jgi:prepilin-type N-terminal cleavage/methylation domain-containing protein